MNVRQPRGRRLALALATVATAAAGTLSTEARPVTASAAPLALAAQTVSTTSVVSVTDCQGLISGLAANPASTATERKHILSTNPATGCTAHGTVTTRPVAPTVKSSALITASYPCETISGQIVMDVLNTYAATAYIHVQMCWNGSYAWNDWGPDCPISTVPIMGSTPTWVGVYHNYQWLTQPGANYNLWYYWSPWTYTQHWIRVWVYGNGYVAGIYGG